MNNPISPHLTVYKPQITSTLSIFHRISGSILGLALVALAFILQFVSLNGLGSHETLVILQQLLTWSSFLIELIAFTLIFSLYYHLFNGIRHFVWDLNHALAMNRVNQGGYIVLSLTFLFSLATFLLFF